VSFVLKRTLPKGEIYMELDLLQIIFLILIGAGAGFVQRVAGFGLGIFAMLFLPYLMPSGVVVVVACLLSCCTSSYNAVKYRKNIHFATMLPPLVAALAVIPVMVRFSATVPEEQLKLMLGAALIILSIYFIFFSKRIHIRPSVPAGLLCGIMGGTMSSLFSMGGPPIVLYLVHALKDKTAYFATIQFYFAINNIYTTVVRAANGIITGQMLLISAIGLVGCLAGNRIGGLVFDKLDSEKIKLVIYIGMIVSGVLMIL